MIRAHPFPSSRMSNDTADKALTLCAQIDAIADEMERNGEPSDDNMRIQRFAGIILREHRRELCDVDGGTIQDVAVECGLLVCRAMSSPCGENCRCDAFPCECFFLSALGERAVDGASYKVTHDGAHPHHGAPTS